jgi:hypothetical protein
VTLNPPDELRHPHDDDPNWRESWYWNFSDPVNEIGGWLYFWVLPNQPLKSGMLVSFYHGVPATFDSTGAAMASPGHLLRGDDGSWVYCFNQDFEHLIDEDVDDATLGGLRLKRDAPFEQYSLSFSDGDNANFDLQCTWMSDPWDFADNIHPTPAWLAKDRYHRGWLAKGHLEIAGTRYEIDTTGDSDHSWGTRDMSVFRENNLKTYALQSADGGLSVKAQMLGAPGHELPRGYIAHGRDMQAVCRITESSRYTPTGEMYDISLEVEDVTGRIVRCHMDSMFGAVAGGGSVVGFEGAGVWEVEDWGRCAGLASCWWAEGVTREQLHLGEAGITLG